MCVRETKYQSNHGSFLQGVTSGLFHATLWHVYHKLDESFENMTLIAILYHHKRSDPQRSRLTLYCLLHCLLASALIFAIPAVFCEVHLAVVVSLVLFRFSEIGTKDAAAGLLLKAATMQLVRLILSYLNIVLRM